MNRAPHYYSQKSKKIIKFIIIINYTMFNIPLIKIFINIKGVI